MDEKMVQLARMAMMAAQDKYRNLLKWYGAMVRMAMHYKKLWRDAYYEMQRGILPAVKEEAHYKRMWECRRAEAQAAMELIRNHKKLEEMEEETAKFIILSAERMMEELENAYQIEAE
jgi:ribosomal protein L16 Arg81 hydroxylase